MDKINSTANQEGRIMYTLENLLAFVWGMESVVIKDSEIICTLRDRNNFDLRAQSFLREYEQNKRDPQVMEVLHNGMERTLRIIDSLTKEIYDTLRKVKKGDLTLVYQSTTDSNIKQLRSLLQEYGFAEKEQN